MNRLPAAQDVARLIRPSVEETVDVLSDHYRRARPSWSYDPVRQLARQIYSGELPEPLVVAAIEKRFGKPVEGEKSNNPKAIGRKSNLEVSRLLRQHAVGRIFQCYPLAPRKVALSPEHAITVNPGFYFVENGIARIHWLQPRRAYGLSMSQMGLLGGLLRLSFFRDDFEGAELELTDFSAVFGERHCRVFSRADLPVLSESDLQKQLECFLLAYLQIKDVDLRPKSDRKSEPNIKDQGEFDFTEA